MVPLKAERAELLPLSWLITRVRHLSVPVDNVANRDKSRWNREGNRKIAWSLLDVFWGVAGGSGADGQT